MSSDTEQSPLTDREQEKWKDLVEMVHDDLPDKEVTSMVKLSIRRRFDPPEWVMAFEYPAPNGKRADAIAYNTLPSRNYKIVGFEFKASRSDWLREKKDGEKADYFVQVCDEWYIVAGRKGIVEEHELPDGWGLMELKPNSGQIWKLVESDLPDHLDTGEQVDRRFLSKFMKTAVGGESNYNQRDIREAKRRGYQEAKEDDLERETDYELRKLREKAENFDALVEAGFDFVEWKDIDEETLEYIDIACKLVRGMRRGGYTNLASNLNGLRRKVNNNVQSDLNKLLESIEETREGLSELNELVEAGGHAEGVETDGGDA